MPRVVDRDYLVRLLNQCYVEQELDCCFYMKKSSHYCEKCFDIEEELRKKGFNKRNDNVNVWKNFYKKMIRVTFCCFSLLKKKILLEFKYVAVNNSSNAIEPLKATLGSTEYDFFFSRK